MRTQDGKVDQNQFPVLPLGLATTGSLVALLPLASATAVDFPSLWTCLKTKSQKRQYTVGLINLRPIPTGFICGDRALRNGPQAVQNTSDEPAILVHIGTSRRLEWILVFHMTLRQPYCMKPRQSASRSCTQTSLLPYARYTASHLASMCSGSLT